MGGGLPQLGMLRRSFIKSLKAWNLSEEELKEKRDLIPPGVHVLITHSPPKGTVHPLLSYFFSSLV